MNYFAQIYIIIVAILSIAATGIAIKAYNDNQAYNPYGNTDMRKSNYIFLWVNIVLLCTVILTTIVGIYFDISYPPEAY